MPGAEGLPCWSLGPRPPRGAPAGAEDPQGEEEGVPCCRPLLWGPEGRLEQSALGRTGCGRAPGGIWGLAWCPDGSRPQLVLTDGHGRGTAALMDDRSG